MVLAPNYQSSWPPLLCPCLSNSLRTLFECWKKGEEDEEKEEDEEEEEEEENERTRVNDMWSNTQAFPSHRNGVNRMLATNEA